MSSVSGDGRRHRPWLGILGSAAFALSAASARADDWPQWMGPQRDGVWRESGLLEKFPKDGPRVRWRTPIGGGYAGPAVAGGREYVTDRVLKPDARDPANLFARGQTPAIERVLCLNEADGKVLWKHEYDCTYTISYPAGPRTTPVVQEGKVYTLGAEGHLLCLESETGKVVWSRDLKKDYQIASSPMWGFSSNPMVDGNRLICLVGGKGTTVVAFDKETGKELWKALDSGGPHGPGYSSPAIYEAGGRRQLIVWHPEALSSLDPETGKVYWEEPFRIQSGISLAMPRKDGDTLYVSAFYSGSLMLRLDREKPAAGVVWKRKGRSERQTDALHCLIGTPFLENGHIYGVDSYGELRCLKADTGDRLWETLEATGARGPNADRWATAFIVKNGDRFFLFNEKGELIIAKLGPKQYEEVSRARLLEPTNKAQARAVVWSHPAFANRSVYARNDKEIVCVSLAASEQGKLRVGGEWTGTWGPYSPPKEGEAPPATKYTKVQLRLDCKVVELGGGKWQATFEGECGRPYKYTIQMPGRQVGDVVLFQGSADLGEQDGGVYDWIGRANEEEFVGFYTSRKYTGHFRLARPKQDKPAAPPDKARESAQAAFPRPVGIFSVGLRRQPPPKELLEKPFVDGVTIAEGWVYAEPSEGKYDFSTIEKALAAVEAFQKKLTICLFPFPVPDWLNKDPNVQTYKVPHAGPGFATPVPWDERGLTRWEALCKALSEHRVPDRAQGGELVPLRDHPLLSAVHCWPMGMNGIRDIAMMTGKDTPLHQVPNYSREKLTSAILRSTHAMVDRFPKQFHCLPFFRIQDDTASLPLEQHLIGALRKEFWSGKGSPRAGLLQENLSAGGPNASGGSVLIQEKSDTYIMLQAIESWAKPTQGFAGAVRQGAPEDAIRRGYEIFDCRYFEIYLADLLHKDFEDGFQKWHTFLHRGGPKPAPVKTAVEEKAPAEGQSGRLKSVDLEKNTITVTIGERDQVFPVAGARLVRPDGGEIPGGLQSVKGFLERQAMAVTVKTEKKEDKEVVTEVRFQPAGRPNEKTPAQDDKPARAQGRPANPAGPTVPQEGSLKPGDSAPDFTLKLLDDRDGKTVSLADLKGKKPLVLIFGSFT